MAGLFESLTSDAVFTVAHSILYVGTSLGFSLRPMVSKGLNLVRGCLRVATAVQQLAGPALFFPGGLVGMILRHFFRMFNLIFFPQLLAFTGGLAVAMGLACLLAVPKLFAKIYKFVSTQVMKGVHVVFKQAQRKLYSPISPFLPAKRLGALG